MLNQYKLDRASGQILDAPVEHAAQDFGGHDDALRAWVDGDVARHEAHVRELLAELPEFLVAQRLKRSGSGHFRALGR